MTSADIITAIRATYPKYSKAVHSMVRHGDEYGVQLRRPAQRILDSLTAETTAPPKPEHRQNDTRLQFRLTFSECERLKTIANLNGHATMQSYLAAVARKIIKEETT